MEQKTQIQIFVLPYTFEDSKTLVLGKIKNTTWVPFEQAVDTKVIMNFALAATTLNKPFYENKKQNLIKALDANVVKGIKNNAAKIFHQQTFNLFAQKEKGLPNLSYSTSINYFLDKINATEYFYIDQSYAFAIFFIEVPYVSCLSLQESKEKLLETPKISANEFSFLWIEMDKIIDCCEDSDFLGLLKTPEITNIISTLEQKAQIDSDDDEVIVTIEGLDEK